MISKLERWVVAISFGVFFIAIFILAIQENILAVIFLIFLFFVATYSLVRTEIEDRKMGRKSYRWYLKHRKCPDCNSKLIYKYDLWLNDEEWGIPEEYMCIKCGKGVDVLK